MLDLAAIRDRLLAQPASPLRDVLITANVDEAMKEAVRSARALVLDLGEDFGRNASASGQVSQVVRAEFGVLLALPDHGRADQASVLQAPRTFVRQALLGWAPSGLTAIEGRRGRLMAAGPVLWWLDTFATEYITTGA